jgi:single stranded DNA-binding protein
LLGAREVINQSQLHNTIGLKGIRMSLVNKVLLDGNLGADPEIRYTTDELPIVNVNLATNESYKDKASGERKTVTEWHRLVFFGQSATLIKEHARKGSALKIEGYLRTRKWEKDSQTHYTTEVVVEEFRFGPSPVSSQSVAKTGEAAIETDIDSEVPF